MLWTEDRALVRAVTAFTNDSTYPYQSTMKYAKLHGMKRNATKLSEYQATWVAATNALIGASSVSEP